MHQHNALHNFTDLQRAYQKALGERDAQFAGIERGGETLTPVIDLWTRPEWAILRGERLGGVNRTVTAVAAEFGVIGLCNPVGSRRIITVERISSRVLVAAVLAMGTCTDADAQAAPLGSSQQAFTRDARGGLISQAVVRYGTLTGAELAAFTSQGLESRQANLTTDWTILPVVLPPGRALIVSSLDDNADLGVSFGFLERAALHGELE